MLNTKETGKLGECIARNHLINEGYTILNQNYSTRYGEIDIIARDGKFITFVEVKTRRGESFGLPREAVDKYKQNKIKNMAQVYILRNKIADMPVRFDVVEIFIDDDNKEKSVSIIKNAFE